MSAVGLDEAQRLLADEGYAYIDVRSELEFSLGHPPGAYNVPWQLRRAEALQDNPRFLAVVRAHFEPGRALIVGCERGERSRQALTCLAEAGYREVRELSVGYGGKRDVFGRVLERGWRDAGLPIASDALPGRDYASLLEAAGSGERSVL